MASEQDEAEAMELLYGDRVKHALEVTHRFIMEQHQYLEMSAERRQLEQQLAFKEKLIEQYHKDNDLAVALVQKQNADIERLEQQLAQAREENERTLLDMRSEHNRARALLSRAAVFIEGSVGRCAASDEIRAFLAEHPQN